MRLIAHRGFAATEAENTISAVRNAAGRADAVEFDVRRCGSGELVVIHDETIDRVTDGIGTVSETPLEELKTVTVLDSGERIPTLEEVLTALDPELEVNLEIKDRGVAGDVLGALEGVENRVVVTSFLQDELAAVRAFDADQPIGLLTSRRLADPVTRAIELDCDVIGANYFRCLFTPLVSRAHAVDLEVHAWSITRSELAQVLEVRGVDCVSSDRPISV